jgi:hypothetical protein
MGVEKTGQVVIRFVSQICEPPQAGCLVQRNVAAPNTNGWQEKVKGSIPRFCFFTISGAGFHVVSGLGQFPFQNPELVRTHPA